MTTAPERRVVETARLTLRPFTIDDAESVLAEVGLAGAIPALEKQWVLQATDLPAGW